MELQVFTVVPALEARQDAAELLGQGFYQEMIDGRLY